MNANSALRIVLGIVMILFIVFMLCVEVEAGMPPPRKFFVKTPVAQGDGGRVDPFVQHMLDAHNIFREVAGVPPLKWSVELAQYAQEYSQKCVFEHSPASYGENLIMGNYQDDADMARGVTMWHGEICYYDFDNPGFSLSTGHYTQIVWKNTQYVGCGFTMCQGGVKPFLKYVAGLLVCEYFPAGNVRTQFSHNVLKPKSMPACDQGIIKW